MFSSLAQVYVPLRNHVKAFLLLAASDRGGRLPEEPSDDAAPAAAGPRSVSDTPHETTEVSRLVSDTKAAAEAGPESLSPAQETRVLQYLRDTESLFRWRHHITVGFVLALAAFTALRVSAHLFVGVEDSVVHDMLDHGPGFWRAFNTGSLDHLIFGLALTLLPVPLHRAKHFRTVVAWAVVVFLAGILLEFAQLRFTTADVVTNAIAIGIGLLAAHHLRALEASLAERIRLRSLIREPPRDPATSERAAQANVIEEREDLMQFSVGREGEVRLPSWRPWFLETEDLLRGDWTKFARRFAAELLVLAQASEGQELKGERPRAALEELREKIALCVREAVTNALVHGNHLMASQIAIIRWKVEDGTITVEVDDQGARPFGSKLPAFNPEQSRFLAILRFGHGGSLDDIKKLTDNQAEPVDITDEYGRKIGTRVRMMWRLPDEQAPDTNDVLDSVAVPAVEHVKGWFGDVRRRMKALKGAIGRSI